MSTKAANGSGSSSRSKKSSGSKHSSKTKSTSSRASTRSRPNSNAEEGSLSSGDSANSANTRQYIPSERLVDYLNDTEHCNVGYSSSYTTALTYTFGFPEVRQARTEMEHEMIAESEARALESIDEYGRRVGHEERQY